MLIKRDMPQKVQEFKLYRININLSNRIETTLLIFKIYSEIAVSYIY